MQTETVRDPKFDPEARALLELLGTREPMDYPTLRVDREEPPDPSYAGTPDPRVQIAELHLPLRWGPCRARLYTSPRRERGPLVLWLHGGAFVGGSARDLDAPCAQIALGSAATVVSLEYRLAPEHPFPAAVHDTCDALDWLTQHGRTIGGDGQVAVGGQSAGGNLAAAACLWLRDRDGRAGVDAQVLCYPLLDFGQDTESARLFNGVLLDLEAGRWEGHAYLAGQTPTSYAAPLRAESLVGLPPALVIGAGWDPLRDDARAYGRRLERAGVPVRHLEYDATVHAFLNFSGALSAAPHAADVIADYLFHVGREDVSPSAAPRTGRVQSA